MISKLEQDLQPTFEEPSTPTNTRKSQLNNVKRQFAFQPAREVEDTSILIKCIGDGLNGMPSQHSSSFIFCSNEVPATDFRLVQEGGRYYLVLTEIVVALRCTPRLDETQAQAIARLSQFSRQVLLHYLNSRLKKINEIIRQIQNSCSTDRLEFSNESESEI